jgi:hypothetical protein
MGSVEVRLLEGLCDGTKRGELQHCCGEDGKGSVLMYSFKVSRSMWAEYPLVGIRAEENRAGLSLGVLTVLMKHDCLLWSLLPAQAGFSYVLFLSPGTKSRQGRFKWAAKASVFGWSVLRRSTMLWLKSWTCSLASPSQIDTCSVGVDLLLSIIWNFPWLCSHEDAYYSFVLDIRTNWQGRGTPWASLWSSQLSIC